MMRRRKTRGFTLLEVLVATTIMAIAVAALLQALSGSLKNASRLTESDRAVILAKRTLDQLLVEPGLPVGQIVEARFDPRATGMTGGWRARVEPFESVPGAPADAGSIERIVLEIYYPSGTSTRTFMLEGYRRTVKRP